MLYNVEIHFPEQEADSKVSAAKDVIKYICENPSDIFVYVDGEGIDLQFE